MKKNNPIAKFFLDKDHLPPTLDEITPMFTNFLDVKYSTPSYFNLGLVGNMRYVVLIFKKGCIEVCLADTSRGIFKEKMITNAKDFLSLKETMISYVIHGIRKVPELKEWEHKKLP